MSELRVAAIQHDIVWNEPEANHERLAPKIAAAAASLQFGGLMSRAALATSSAACTQSP